MLVYVYRFIFLAKMCCESVEDVSVAADIVALHIYYLTDDSCLTSFDHFENMEEGGFLIFHFVLSIVVQHDLLHSPRV